HLVFFFLLSRRHPRATLFPYTTLFRSQEMVERRCRAGVAECSDTKRGARPALGVARLHLASEVVQHVAQVEPCIGALWGDVHQRSEEHTSELQSLAYLVCRLLLEKKNS